MTPKEAAEILKDLQGFHLLVIEQNQALELAIQALEEKHEPEIVPICTKVMVTKCLYGHRFKIGETVIIIEHVSRYNPNYKCEGDCDFWFLSREEFEIIEQ